jgi:hypothetical protein
MRLGAVAAALVAVACSSPAHPPTGPGSASGSESASGSGSASDSGSGSGSGLGSATADVIDAASAKAAIGKQVTVRGTAKAAKLGPVVVVADLIVYCLSFPDWPSGVSGQHVAAHGLLQLTDEFASHQGPDGEVSQGTSGSVFVLRECGYDKQ